MRRTWIHVDCGSMDRTRLDTMSGDWNIPHSDTRTSFAHALAHALALTDSHFIPSPSSLKNVGSGSGVSFGYQL